MSIPAYVHAYTSIDISIKILALVPVHMSIPAYVHAYTRMPCSRTLF